MSQQNDVSDESPDNSTYAYYFSLTYLDSAIGRDTHEKRAFSNFDYSDAVDDVDGAEAADEESVSAF